jgi:hypothetical protein
MPGPSPSSALQRPDLAATFESFDLEGSRRQFIGGVVAPTLEVQLQSANVGKLPLAALLAGPLRPDDPHFVLPKAQAHADSASGIHSRDEPPQQAVGQFVSTRLTVWVDRRTSGHASSPSGGSRQSGCWLRR